MKNYYKYIVCILIFFMILLFPSIQASAEEKTVIIDPGHGGEELGGTYGTYIEKDMTLKLAKQIKNELEQYSGIEVILTRDSDITMPIKDRANFAKEHHADLVLSLHFNKSETNILYGSELWISAFDEYYVNGLAFSNILNESFQGMGLVDRGIKTRLNKEGLDYYGIIRYSRELEIPCVLIEHCHMDNHHDEEYIDDDNDYNKWSSIDAEAVAKYFGLSSSVLGKDYSNYTVSTIDRPIRPVEPDYTPPDIAYIELIDVDASSREVELDIYANDYDSQIIYASISYDDGANWSEYYSYQQNNLNKLRIKINIPNSISHPIMQAKVANQYDLVSMTESIVVEGFDHVAYDKEEYTHKSDISENVQLDQKVGNHINEKIDGFEGSRIRDVVQVKKESSLLYFIKVIAVIIGILLLLTLMVVSIKHIFKLGRGGYWRRKKEKR